MKFLFKKVFFLGIVNLFLLVACKPEKTVPSIPKPVALHHLRHPTSNDHFYTTDVFEKNNAITTYGYAYDGIACSIDTMQNGTVPLYRTRRDQYHFYTASAVEKNNAISVHRYIPEGIAGYVHETAKEGTIPLYRLLHMTKWYHFYTTDVAEKDNAVKNEGYKYEGIACYVYP